MKNVAGYDVSRLVCGSFGTLGVVLSVSVRLRPRPESECTLRLEVAPADAARLQRSWRILPLPLAGTCYADGALRVRLAGAAAAVRAAAQAIGGEAVEAEPFWQQLAAHELPFFRDAHPVRRSVTAPADPLPPPEVPTLVEWGGGLRWTRSAAVPDAPGIDFDARYAAASFAAQSAAVLRYQRRLKGAFDPQGLFNPHLLEPHAD
jgi:glycolate oxidase FAD binding subunit